MTNGCYHEKTNKGPVRQQRTLKPPVQLDKLPIYSYYSHPVMFNLAGLIFNQTVVAVILRRVVNIDEEQRGTLFHSAASHRPLVAQRGRGRL